jgi:hypothetical protein
LILHDPVAAAIPADPEQLRTTPRGRPAHSHKRRIKAANASPSFMGAPAREGRCRSGNSRESGQQNKPECGPELHLPRIELRRDCGSRLLHEDR